MKDSSTGPPSRTFSMRYSAYWRGAWAIGVVAAVRVRFVSIKSGSVSIPLHKAPTNLVAALRPDGDDHEPAHLELLHQLPVVLVCMRRCWGVVPISRGWYRSRSRVAAFQTPHSAPMHHHMHHMHHKRTHAPGHRGGRRADVDGVVGGVGLGAVPAGGRGKGDDVVLEEVAVRLIGVCGVCVLCVGSRLGFSADMY